MNMIKILADYFSKVKKLMFNPAGFFVDAQKQKGYKEPTKFLFVTLFFISILFLFLLLILPSDLKIKFIFEFSGVMSALGLGASHLWILSFLTLLEIFAFGFVGVLAGSLMIHIFSVFFGGKGKYEDSYKIVAYVSILAILQPIASAIISLGDYLDKVIDVTSGYVYLVFAIPVIFILIRLWFLVILITGVKKIYSVKTKEAFLAISSFGALLFFVTAILKPAYFPNMSNIVAVGLSVLLVLILAMTRKVSEKTPQEQKML